MTKLSIDEILLRALPEKKRYWNAGGASGVTDINFNKRKEAKAALSTAILEAKPEKKKLSSDTWLKVKFKEGYNEALDDYHTNLKEVLK